MVSEGVLCTIAVELPLYRLVSNVLERMIPALERTEVHCSASLSLAVGISWGMFSLRSFSLRSFLRNVFKIIMVSNHARPDIRTRGFCMEQPMHFFGVK